MGGSCRRWGSQGAAWRVLDWSSMGTCGAQRGLVGRWGLPEASASQGKGSVAGAAQPSSCSAPAPRCGLGPQPLPAPPVASRTLKPGVRGTRTKRGSRRGGTPIEGALEDPDMGYNGGEPPPVLTCTMCSRPSGPLNASTPQMSMPPKRRAQASTQPRCLQKGAGSQEATPSALIVHAPPTRSLAPPPCP